MSIIDLTYSSSSEDEDTAQSLIRSPHVLWTVCDVIVYRLPDGSLRFMNEVPPALANCAWVPFSLVVTSRTRVPHAVLKAIDSLQRRYTSADFDVLVREVSDEPDYHGRQTVRVHVRASAKVLKTRAITLDFNVFSNWDRMDAPSLNAVRVAFKVLMMEHVSGFAASWDKEAFESNTLKRLEMGSPAAQPDGLVEGCVLHEAQRRTLQRMLDIERAALPVHHIPFGGSVTVCFDVLLGRPRMVADAKRVQRGGLVCDVMGSGKTLTALSLCLANPGTAVKRTLIVCPASIVHQWEHEISTKAPGLTCKVFHGPRRPMERSVFLERMGSADVIITTYGIFRNEVLREVAWRRIIYDESHETKSWGNCAIPRAACIWFMSATPCVKEVKDVRPCLNILVSGSWTAVFDTKAAMRLFGIRELETPTGLPLLSEETVALTLSDTELERYEALHMQALTMQRAAHGRRKNVMIGRIQNGVRIFCSSGEYERTQDAVVGYDQYPLDPKGHRLPGCPCVTCEREGEDVESDFECAICFDQVQSPLVTPCGHWFCMECILEALHVKKTCPLCRGNVTPLKLCRPMCLAGADGAGGSVETTPQLVMKVKVEALVQRLEGMQDDPLSRALVFSQFPQTLSMLERELKARGIQTSTISGTMTPQKRAKIVATFEAGEATVLLLNVRIGGVGINLTRADHVFIMEPGTPKDLERQAIGRAHRQGQCRPVTVVRFYVQDTIEARIMEQHPKDPKTALLDPFHPAASRNVRRRLL